MTEYTIIEDDFLSADALTTTDVLTAIARSITEHHLTPEEARLAWDSGLLEVMKMRKDRKESANVAG